MKSQLKIDNPLKEFEEVEEEHLKRLKALASFHEIGKALTSTLDLKEVLRIMMDKISELLNPKDWSLLLVDEERKDLYFEIVVGKGSEKIKKARLKRGEGIAGWVAKEGEPLFVPDVAKDKRFSARIDNISNYITESIICAPLKSKGRVLGVVELINKGDSGLFKEEDLNLLTTLADYTAIAIENAKYFQKVQDLTITDDVTTLYNSRYLHRFLEYESERARRYKSNLSLIFLDIDYFKRVNDTYGHICGSKLLKEIGVLLLSKIRKVDVACRYGGDEFVLVLPHTTKEDAFNVAKKIKSSMKQTRFLKDEGLKIKITASFGVASIPSDSEDSTGLIRLADNAMYKVKGLSRDGVLMA
jgi:diguanylate cyclase (GGDEF)-like protein